MSQEELLIILYGFSPIIHPFLHCTNIAGPLQPFVMREADSITQYFLRCYLFLN